MVGSSISRYKVLEKLGEGGMGVVYKAEDMTLGRPIALKFLAPHLVSNVEVRKRFLREARTAAALSHPNICTVYEIGEADGRTFISMAYLEGRELADEIEDGPIVADRGLRLATQFAQGLAAAHAKGIVHRDIKPANLFVTSDGDRGVILDFGLAQLSSADSKLTREGTTLGTCAYMSPEQSTGADVDARTDVWALGCVLYEMLAGEQPFRGHYEQAIVYSIINEEPEPLENVPTEIEAVIQRCLAKKPEERYDDGKELLEALKGRQPSARTSSAGVSGAPSEVPRLAVLPVKTGAGEADMESFAEGLTEEITTGLAQFRHLAVVSTAAAARVRNQPDAREASNELDARFLLEGSIRRAGSNVRVSMQLLDAQTDAHLWAERYDRTLAADDIFSLQDELTDRIVATVADPSGALTRALAAFAKSKPLDTLGTDECVLRFFGYQQQFRPDEHAVLRTALERAVAEEPDHSGALASLSLLYLDEHRHDYNVWPGALDRALETAQRAVEADGTSQFAYRALAEAHYHRRELGAFRSAADRAVSLNPRDTSNVGMMGDLIGKSGDWEKGCELVRKVMQLNPHHSGWLYFVFTDDYYRRREYEQALAAAEKIRMPGIFWESETLAMINGQLGRTQEASKHLKRFVELAPDVARNIRAEDSKWYVSEEFIEHRLEGLRKAGLEIEADPEPPAAAPSDVPRLAVLSLKTRTGDVDMESLAEGLTEEITTGLSQFRHLIVVSAAAAAGVRNKSDAREASEELGARFLVEGSIRKAGSSVRVSMQLLDAQTGAHLWAERYDRRLGADDIFALQDELTDRIVATVADPFGVLTRSLAAQVKTRPTDAPTAHEAVLLTFAYWQHVRPDEQAAVRTALERALEREPDHAEALACLARLQVDEHRFNFDPAPDALDRALRTAQRAVELDATSQLAYRSLAEAHFYRREPSGFRRAADRALALNPRDTANVHWMGMLIAYSGEWETGHSIAAKVEQLNPHHPSWFYMFYLSYHYWASDYERALEAAEKVDMPGYYFVSLELAMITAQLGRTEEARKHLKRALELAPDLARYARAEIAKWWGCSEEFVEHKLDGLRKAGLKIPGDTEAPAAPASQVPRVAVLPLKTSAADAGLESFAEGLTEEVTTGLSQFRHLVVVSSSAAAGFKGLEDLGEVGRQLDARFLIEGSARKTGSSIRVSMQLVDAATGAHLWAERFDRDLVSADVLAVQDELTDRIVATVADPFGVLTRSLSAAMKAQPVETLTAQQCVLRTFGYWQQVHASEHAELRSALEHVVNREPNHADALACLSILYLEEYYAPLNPQPNPLERGLKAAQRAVELDAMSQLAYRALASAYFFHRDFGAFRIAADRVLALNPRDTLNVGMIGLTLAESGDWENGLEILRGIMALNPHHAGWLHLPFMWNHYRLREYEQAADAAKKIDMPGFAWMTVGLAAIYGQLGQGEAARKELKTLTDIAPDVARNARTELAKWLEPELVEHILEGLQKTGLEAANAPQTQAASSHVPRIAIRPLKTTGGDGELGAFAEGLTEEITTGLSQFRHLVVVSSKAAAGVQGARDLRQVGDELDARFVLEGSVRKTGSKIRVSVQLVDVSSGAHLWAERFDKDLETSDILEAQDKLTDRIVATVADPEGVLTRALGALVKAKRCDELTAHECVLWTFAYWQQVVPEEHADVRRALERALEREPENAEAWACISRVYLDEFRFDFNVLPDSLDRALKAAQRAVELDATSQLAYRALGEAHYFRKERGAFVQAADRVLALNPRDTSNVGMIGNLIAISGEWERGCEAVRNVMQLNPHHAGWLNFVFFEYHYHRTEYEQALKAVEKVNMPGHHPLHADLAIVNAQLGRMEEARKHLKTLIELKPDVARSYPVEMSKWYFSAELLEHKLEGLRKAGLDLDGAKG